MLRVIRLGQERKQIRADIPAVNVAMYCRAFAVMAASVVRECGRQTQVPPEHFWRFLAHGVQSDLEERSTVAPAE